VAASESNHTSPIRAEEIHPYVSLTILEHLGSDPRRDFATLTAKLLQLKSRERSGRRVVIIRSGVKQALDGTFWNSEDPDLDIDGFISQVTALPGWAKQGAPFQETSLDLAICLRRRRIGPRVLKRRLSYLSGRSSTSKESRHLPTLSRRLDWMERSPARSSASSKTMAAPYGLCLAGTAAKRTKSR
jgi:hypothetical protein